MSEEVPALVSGSGPMSLAGRDATLPMHGCPADGSACLPDRRSLSDAESRSPRAC